MSQTKELPPPIQLLQLITGSWVAQAVAVAAELRLADLVKDGAKNTADLAAATKTHEPSLFRLMRALASRGVFKETGNRVFAQTPMSEALVTKPTGSMRAMALFCGDKAHMQAWGEMLHSVRTGETAFVRAKGEGFFPYIKKHPEVGEIFDQA